MSSAVRICAEKSSNMLEVTIYAEDGMVIVRAETPEGVLDIPLTIEVAAEWIKRMQDAIDYAGMT